MRWDSVFYHEGAKDTKVWEKLNSELRALRAFVVSDSGDDE
jgi:hypothetical protein